MLQIADEVLDRAGYEPFETPVFEDTEVFARGVGESTDIVQKEMFTFEDKAGRSLTLRPENTAGVCRAYAEHGMHKLPQPVKLWTWGPFFRHEAPQAGRFRQFTQVDAEALGSDDPSLDAELILLMGEILDRVGAGELRLRLSSLGSPDTRAAYLDELRAYLRTHEDRLSDEVRGRLDQNPLRAFDADHPGTRAVMEEAPRLLDRLRPGRRRPLRRGAGAARRRRARVRGRLDPGARAGLLHAHGVRVRVAAAGRAERAGRRRALRPAGRGAGRSAHARCGLCGGHRAHPAGRRRGAFRAGPPRVRRPGQARRLPRRLPPGAATARATASGWRWSRPGGRSRAS